jgi:integrase
VKHSVRARTYESYRQLAELHVIPAIGSVRLVALTPGHVQSMLALVLANGRSVTTAQKVRATLSAALHAAQLDHGLSRNVASLAKMPKTDRPSYRPEVVTPEHARRILDAFAGSRIEPLVLFAVATGLRHGEMLALRWQDIDPERNTFTVTHAVDIRAASGSWRSPRPKGPNGHSPCPPWHGGPFS